MLGVQGALMQQCVVYGRILFLAQGAFMLQTMFQTFFVAAEKMCIRDRCYTVREVWGCAARCHHENKPALPCQEEFA